jgi:hypothetical protein
MSNRTSIIDTWWHIEGIQASSKNTTLGPEGPKYTEGTLCLFYVRASRRWTVLNKVYNQSNHMGWLVIAKS